MGKNIINIALFGLGRIGQMHANNLINHKDFNLKYIFDKDQKLTEKLSKKYNSIGIQNLDSFPRIKIWSESINYISIKPLLGWGASSFPSLFEINNNSTFFGHTHNLPLELSLSFGIPVALIITTIIYRIIGGKSWDNFWLC